MAMVNSSKSIIGEQDTSRGVHIRAVAIYFVWTSVCQNSSGGMYII